MVRSNDGDPPDSVRLDKWLWAARFVKTRRLAVEAIDGGRVQVNGERVKRAKLVHAGDRVRIRKGPYETQITVLMPLGRRGSAKDAARLYEESEESLLARTRLVEQHRLAARASASSKGKPTKKERRQIGRFKGRD